MIVTSCSPSSAAAAVETSRFPKLDECAHFHYDVVDLGPLTVRLFGAARLVLFCLFGAHSQQADGRTIDGDRSSIFGNCPFWLSHLSGPVGRLKTGCK
jgi:hypothetical protein